MISRLARFGYVCIGVVYVVAGGLAASAGMGHGGSTGGQKGAFAFILRQPFGRLLLGIIAVGLAGYALWRILSGLTDSENRGSDAKGWALRIGSVARGCVYGVIAFSVARLAWTLRATSSSGDTQTKHWTATLMDMPFGRWLVAAAGLTVFGYGIYQIYKGVAGKLSSQLRLSELDDAVRRKVVAVSRAGITARGVVFLIIGGSILVAARHANPREARGTSGALQKLAQPAHGWPLVVIGIGLAAYGVYAFVNARTRRIAT